MVSHVKMWGFRHVDSQKTLEVADMVANVGVADMVIKLKDSEQSRLE